MGQPTEAHRAGGPGPADPAARSPWRREAGFVVPLFLASKAALAVVALLASILFGPGNYFAGHAVRVGFERYFVRWDAAWYLNVAHNGYTFNQDGTGSVVFFPLYPLLIRALSALHLNPAIAGIVLSNACFLAALWVFYRLVQATFGREALAQHATALLAFAPGLAWFSIGYSESLFLLLSTVTFLQALRQRFLVAAAFGVLAGLARPNALLLALPLAFLVGPALLQDRQLWRVPAGWRRLLAIAAPVVGHGIFLAYLQFKFGTWHAVSINELKGWDAHVAPSWELYRQLVPTVGLHLFDNPEIFREHVAWSWLLVEFTTAFALIALWEKRARLWLAVFLLGYFGLHCSIVQLGAPMYAIARYSAPLFPLYLAVALFAEDRPWARHATLGIAVMGMTITTLMLFAGYHIN